MQQKKEKIKAALSLLAKIDGETIEQKAATLGVHRTTLWRWRKKPEMQDVLDELAGVELELILMQITDILSARCMEGDYKAMELIFEISGIASVEKKIADIVEAGITPSQYTRYYHALRNSPSPQ